MYLSLFLPSIPFFLLLVKLTSKEHIQFLAANEELLFFQHYDGPWYPTLRLLHRYPNLLPHLRVDRGAVRFVLSGANIMCPGLTSPGAHMPDDVPADTPVAIMAEGKAHAVAIGVTKMSTKEISEINKGIGVDSVTHLNDGLWRADIQSLNLR